MCPGSHDYFSSLQQLNNKLDYKNHCIITNQVCFILMVSWGFNAYLILIIFLKTEPKCSHGMQNVSGDAPWYYSLVTHTPAWPHRGAARWNIQPPRCTRGFLGRIPFHSALEKPGEVADLEQSFTDEHTKGLLRPTLSYRTLCLLCHCLQCRQEKWTGREIHPA